jgi:hypothetical protein
LTDAVVEECQHLQAGQLDPQVQVFLRIVASVLDVIAQYRVAPATRFVCVLEPSIENGAIGTLAQQVGL